MGDLIKFFFRGELLLEIHTDQPAEIVTRVERSAAATIPPIDDLMPVTNASLERARVPGKKWKKSTIEQAKKLRIEVDTLTEPVGLNTLYKKVFSKDNGSSPYFTGAYGEMRGWWSLRRRPDNDTALIVKKEKSKNKLEEFWKET